MNVLGTFFSVVLLVAVLGFFARKAAEQGAGELFWAWIRCIGATVILTAVFIANFALCSVGLARIVSKEPYAVDEDGRDLIALLLFGQQGAFVSPLWALALVLGSFVAASILISVLRRLADAIIEIGVPAADRWRALLSAAFWGLPCLAVLAFDGYVLAFRVAMQLYSKKMEDGLEALPAIWSLGDMSTMAGSLLVVTMLAYPMLILIVERHFGLAWSKVTKLMQGEPEVMQAPANVRELQPAAHPPAVVGGGIPGAQPAPFQGPQGHVHADTEEDLLAVAPHNIPRIDPPNTNGAEEFIAGVPPANR